jgi:hypothetical protein
MPVKQLPDAEQTDAAAEIQQSSQQDRFDLAQQDLGQRRARAEQHGGSQGLENPECSILCQDPNSTPPQQRVSSGSASPTRSAQP